MLNPADTELVPCKASFINKEVARLRHLDLPNQVTELAGRALLFLKEVKGHIPFPYQNHDRNDKILHIFDKKWKTHNLKNLLSSTLKYIPIHLLIGYHKQKF